MDNKRSHIEMNGDSESAFQEFCYDQTKLKELYPNIKFLIAFPLKMLNRRLSTSKQILIQTSSCNCNKESIDYISVTKKREYDYMRYKDVLEELNNISHEVKCEHQYLKSIQKTKTNDLYKLYFW
jgi:hypothetical protein